MFAKRKDDAWCCSLFKDATQRTDQRGLSIGIARDSIGYGFLLRFRAILQEDMQRFLDLKLAIPVCGLVSQGIKFCPFCGSELQRFYSGKDLPITCELVENLPDWQKAENANR